MNRIKKFFDYLLNNHSALGIALLHRLAFMVPDKLYLQLLFRLKNGQSLNLTTPQNFTEKIQWLKLYDRRPEYTQMVDKLTVKDYVAKKIGNEYIIPTIGVWDKVSDIDFDTLPDQFVLKTTNGGGSGGVVICRDKKSLDINDAKAKLKTSLSHNIYRYLREWPYKGVEKKIIAEKFISIPGQKDLCDYKFYCFNGNVKFCQVIQNRSSHETIDFYDCMWNRQDFTGLITSDECNSNSLIPCPLNYEKMIEIAGILSKNIPFVRIDLYNVNGTIYFGEITFFPASGFGHFSPKKYDYILGQNIKLPEKCQQDL